MEFIEFDTNGDGWGDVAYFDANYNGVFGDVGDYAYLDTNYNGWYETEGWLI